MDQETSRTVMMDLCESWQRDYNVAEMAAGMMMEVKEFVQRKGLSYTELVSGGRSSGVAVQVSAGTTLCLTKTYRSHGSSVDFWLEVRPQTGPLFDVSFDGREGGVRHRFTESAYGSAPWLKDDGNTRSIDAWLRWLIDLLEQSVLN